MNEGIFTEIDITEGSSSQQYTGTPTSNGMKNIEDENVVSKPENFEDQNGLSESCSRESNLSNMAETHNMDTKRPQNDTLSLNIEKYESNEIFSGSNSAEKEFTLKLRTAGESSDCLAEFQFVHHDFSDENRTTNTKNLLKSEEFKDLNVTPGDESKETEQDKNTEVASIKAQKSKSKKFAILHEDELSDGEKGADISMVALLRSTISELERALRDSRTLIKTRDDDIASLRREVEKGMLQSPALSQAESNLD